MSAIQVTATESGPSLALYSCAACGRHVWERDGKLVERDEVLGAVKERAAEARPRGIPLPRPPRNVAPQRAAVPSDVRERLARFQVHGS
ncbi:MAG: hypothetical protein WCD35_00225 [Mycobacteriales bacterium]